MKKKLAIIRADSAQIPLVNKAKEMGIETHCFAWKKEKKHYVCEGIADYFHPISIIEKDQILDVCKEIKIDGVTSMLVSSAVPTVSYIAEKMGLIGNRYEDVLIAKNKYQSHLAFFKNGVSSPRFAIMKDDQIPDISEFKYPLIIKPSDSNSSIGVMKANSEKDLKKMLSDIQQFTDQTIIEEFVSGPEIGVDSISWNGNHFIFAVRDKVTSGSPYFLEIANHMPSQQSPEIIAKIEVETRKALNALNIKFGGCHTDIMVSDKGDVYILEINPFMTEELCYKMIQHSTGLDFLEIAINNALGIWKDPVIVSQFFAGEYFLSKEYEWIRQVIENKDNDPDIVEAVIFDNELHTLQSYNDRSGYFIYKSDKKRTWKGY